MCHEYCSVVYSTVLYCLLNQESVRRELSPHLPDLTMAYWGHCLEPPTILSPPEDTYGPMGANLTLDCEARGFPAPIISWQYENVEGETVSRRLCRY